MMHEVLDKWSEDIFAIALLPNSTTPILFGVTVI